MSSPTKPIIAVVTGTGAQGRSVCAAFQKSGQWTVRALTRNPNGSVAKQLAREGIEVVKADFEKKGDLVKAFTGAWAVYSVTLPPWHTGYGNTMSEYDQGVLQADVAKEVGVKFLLWSTLPYVGPDFMDLGGVELYDSKAAINDYLVSIGMPSVFVSTPIFVDNIMFWPLIKWIDGGSKLEFWHYVLDADKPLTWIWVERDLGPAILGVMNSFFNFDGPLSTHPLNHTIQEIASWRTSYREIACAIERVTGIPVKHTIIPTVDERWHPDLTKAFIYQNTYGLYPNLELPARTFTSLGASFSHLEDYIREKIVPVFGKEAQNKRINVQAKL